MSLAQSVLDTGQAVGPLRLPPRPDGTQFEVSYHALVTGDAVTGDAVTGVVATVRNITDLVEAERREQVLLRATAAMAKTSDAPEIADVIVTEIVGRFADRAAVGLLQDGELRIQAAKGYPSTLTSRLLAAQIGPDHGFPGWHAVTEGATLILSPKTLNDEFPAYADLHDATGDQTIVAVPIRERDTALGVILCSWISPTRATPADIDTVVTLAAVASGALRRVTLARVVTDDRFRRALNASVNGISITSTVRDPTSGQITDFIITYANDASIDSYQRTVTDLVGQSVLATYPQLHQSGLFERFCRVVDTGQPFSAFEYHYADPNTDPPIDTWHQMHIVPFDDGYLASTRDITTEVQARRELEDARVAAESERQATRILRQAALQTDLPTSPRFTIGAAYQPLHDTAPIGGDWYDAFDLDNHRIGVIIGDVAGHGYDAAVAMIEMRTLLCAAARIGQPPGRTLRLVRRAPNRHDTMTTCLYAIIDHHRHTITVASAGHPPPLLYTPTADPTYIPLTPAPPLGFDLPTGTTDTTLPLPTDASIVFYTDGLIETPTEPIDTGLDRLRSTIDPTLAAQAQCDHLARNLTRHHPHDDYCILTITLQPLGDSDSDRT